MSANEGDSSNQGTPVELAHKQERPDTPVLTYREKAGPSEFGAGLNWYDCSCGAEVRLTASEARGATEHGEGCHSLDCQSKDLELRARVDPVVALRLQWEHLYLHSFEELCPEWGGLGLESGSADPEEGRQAFMRYFLSILEDTWWIQRKSEVLPWEETNTYLTSLAWPQVLPDDLQWIRNEGAAQFLPELAKQFNLPLPMVKRLRIEIPDDVELMALLRELCH